MWAHKMAERTPNLISRATARVIDAGQRVARPTAVAFTFGAAAIGLAEVSCGGGSAAEPGGDEPTSTIFVPTIAEATKPPVQLTPLAPATPTEAPKPTPTPIVLKDLFTAAVVDPSID